jgi:hypothetical protein
LTWNFNDLALKISEDIAIDGKIILEWIGWKGVN